jgi:hypothetical protein
LIEEAGDSVGLSAIRDQLSKNANIASERVVNGRARGGETNIFSA